jgi:hypothetical protein
MCIIFAGKIIPSNKELKNAWANNPDGAGVMYTEVGQDTINIFKSLDYSVFAKHISKLRKNININSVVLHFRFATHGEVNLDNAHPFSINGTLAMVHNGVVTQLSKDLNTSDSYLLSRMLSNLPPDWEKNDTILSLLEDYIGEHNKVVILSNSGELVFLNKHKGHELNGIWRSNTDYRKMSYFEHSKESKDGIDTEIDVEIEDYYKQYFDSDKPKDYICDICGKYTDSNKYVCDDCFNYYKTERELDKERKHLLSLVI